MPVADLGSTTRAARLRYEKLSSLALIPALPGGCTGRRVRFVRRGAAGSNVGRGIPASLRDQRSIGVPMRGSWRCSAHAPRSSVCAKGMVLASKRPQPLPVASTASWRTAGRSFGGHIRPSGGVGIQCTACRENNRYEQNCSHQPT